MRQQTITLKLDNSSSTPLLTFLFHLLDDHYDDDEEEEEGRRKMATATKTMKKAMRVMINPYNPDVANHIIIQVSQLL